MTINEIWEQVKVLSPKERDELVRRLLSLPTDTPAAGQMHDILEFEGSPPTSLTTKTHRRM